MEKWTIDLKFLESGDIYFFYKPKKGVEKVNGISDVSRFFFVLQPEGQEYSRYIVLGNKKMPKFTDGGDTTWGFLQMIGGRGFETSKNLKVSTKGTSRPIGEGIYAIVAHKEHTHLLYSLELPKYLGIVQKSFNIQKEADYILASRTIESSPKSFDTPFSNFSPANPADLNKRGTEILLIGVGADIGRLGIRAQKENETLHTADIFSRLKVNSERHPANALISGNWV